jgi:hypothetical protein
MLCTNILSVLSTFDVVRRIADAQRDLLRQAKDVTKEAEEKTGAFPQFGAKPSGSRSSVIWDVVLC